MGVTMAAQGLLAGRGLWGRGVFTMICFLSLSFRSLIISCLGAGLSELILVTESRARWVFMLLMSSTECGKSPTPSLSSSGTPDASPRSLGALCFSSLFVYSSDLIVSTAHLQGC